MGRVVDHVIPYKPRDQFRPYHRRAQRWAALVAHRRCGKTVACINDLIRKAATGTWPNGKFAYVAPFLAQAKEVAWEYLKRFSQPIQADKNEAELWVELVNGARIRIHGADNPDRLRGAYLDGVVLDEYADMRPSVWGEVIRPMLADRQGWATFIGTPKGRNEFFEIYNRAVTDPEWYAVMLRASETGILAEPELISARREMTPEQYEQEFECSFEAAIAGAYYGKEMAAAEREGRITLVRPAEGIPVNRSWDLGIGDNMALWFWQALPGEIRIVDHYENNSQPLSHYVKVAEAKGYEPGDDWLPHDAKVRSLETGRTRVETLQSLGCTPKLIPMHTVMDGINAVRVLLPICWFDRERTGQGVEALRQYRPDYDEKLKTFKDAPRHDWASHSADAFRGIAMAYREMSGKSEPLPVKTTDKLTYQVINGQVKANMSVWDIVEAKRRKKERD